MNYVKIMIVKRDKREVEQLVSIVKSIPGYEISGICDSGQEAVKKILEREPDVVIMDEVLPGKDILEITEEIMHYKNLKNTRILLCGSKTHKEYLDFIYYKIADRLVLRILDVPYDERKIREIIEDILPAHLGIEYVFWYITWEELERKISCWAEIEERQLTWEQLETLVDETEEWAGT